MCTSYATFGLFYSLWLMAYNDTFVSSYNEYFYFVTYGLQYLFYTLWLMIYNVTFVMTYNATFFMTYNVTFVMVMAYYWNDMECYGYVT